MVAASILGGTQELAARLGISEPLLLRLLRGGRPLPDSLLLQAVDVILEDREASTAGPYAMSHAPAAVPIGSD